MPWRRELLKYLSPKAAVLLDGLASHQASALMEIRFRAGCAAAFFYPWGSEEAGGVFSDAEILDLVAALTGYARYRYEKQIAEGYIPLAGGHRAGVCGRMTMENGAWSMARVYAVCLRIRRQIPGASKELHHHMIGPEGTLRSMLLLGAPGSGKTTMLSDAAMYLSEIRNRRVAVVDEREELFPDGLEGVKLDLLSGCGRAKGMMMLLRTMSPEVIVCDEIGSAEDAGAIEEAARCGAAVLASAHADSLMAIRRRPMLRQLFASGAFDRYALLGRLGSIRAVYDSEGNELVKEDADGQLGNRHDGDDCHVRSGLLAF